jgi:hypothetical protein
MIAGKDTDPTERKEKNSRVQTKESRNAGGKIRNVLCRIMMKE